MSDRTAITLLGSPEKIERDWLSSEHRPEWADDAQATVTFRKAPGDRGTEIHVDLVQGAPSGKLGEAAAKLFGKDPIAKVKDGLRRFKQQVETGDIARSDGTPEGELAERKIKQRAAQPLEDSELEKAGLR